MRNITLFFVVLFSFLIVVALFVLVIKSIREMENSSLPMHKEKAKVLKKRVISSEAIVNEIEILFETESGKRLFLQVETNKDIVSGDKGYLTWQGNKVIHFNRILISESDKE